jgi:hypothetical protein
MQPPPNPVHPQQLYQHASSPRKPPNQYPPQMPPKKRVIERFFEIGFGLLIGYFLGFIAVVLIIALALGFSVVLCGSVSQAWGYLCLSIVIAATCFLYCWGLSFRREIENAYILENGDLVEGLVIKHHIQTYYEGAADFYLTYTYEYRGETYSKEQSVSKRTYREIPDGPRIRVRCLPNNRERVWIDRKNNFWDMTKSPDRP